MSPSMQIERSAISRGAPACPRLTQAYTASGFSYAICQKGYLMMPGVL